MAPVAKRRKIDVIRRQKPVEELTFSIDDRQEYLTGFSKRKTARKEQAREQAIREAKEERIRDRKEVHSNNILRYGKN
jgi:ribosomal RNA-processing protein 17